MDSSYNVVRRFTPPTCTLEIFQKSPARYFWQAKQSNEDYQFKLSFDDPRLFEGEAISLSGDQDKLDRLCQVVSTYIEEFLARSFHGSISSEVFSFQISASELVNEQLSNNKLSEGIAPNLEDSQLVDQDQVDQTNSSFSLSELVNHQLDLDSLASKADLSSISLSATQLFDLGSALDDYQEAMAVILQEQKQLQPKQAAIPRSVKVLIGLFTVTLGLWGSRLFFQSRVQNQVASRQQEVTTPSELKVGADVVPPEVAESAKKPVAKVKETPDLSDRERLPPPPAVTTPKPPPNIPDPAKFPPPVSSLTIPPWQPLPSGGSTASSSSSPKTASEQGNSNNPASAKTDLDNTQVEATISIPSQTAKQKDTRASASEKKLPSSTVVEPDRQINNSRSETARIASNPKSATQESAIRESLATRKPQTRTTQTDTNNIEGLPGLSRTNRSSQLRGQENFEDRLAIADQEQATPQNSNNSLANQEEKLALQERKGTVSEPKSSVLRSGSNFGDKPSSNDGELVQLQEINSYFRNKWRSPEELKQTLEYRLIFSQDGSIKRIIPIGKAAGIYLDRTNIPLQGEAFVSPFPEQDAITVRLLLSPDGEVRTFLE